ncbi:MAG: YkgJ family cysteine cluster protein [Candidatus Lokiarchaeota archaeon]|nr:YkgJ family cysteine cluster protein [Candidatus Lokiarchaeota archaeon]
MKNKYFWELISKFNTLMKNSVDGPNCIDPNNCRGDCCSIQIDIPKILAKEYINLGKAKKEDFIRSDIYSFKLRFDEKIGKCFLFDSNINGCSVHETGIKPPQCWIYPTKFNNKNGNPISCKKLSGWRINNLENTKEAKKILNKYNFLCQLEAKKEIRLIKKRINNFVEINNKKIALAKLLHNYAPKDIAGFKDTWNNILPLSAEGISLQMKKFCMKYNKGCKYLINNFLECNQICNLVAQKLVNFIENNLYIIIKKEGVDSDGNYPFILLFKYLE